MQKQNPLLRIWGWGKDEHGRLICAVLGAFVGVAMGMLPYFAAAQVIIKMLAGERELSLYLPWLGIGLAGYAARTLFYNMALSISHKATFSILKTIRQKILAKLPKLPLGTVMDMSGGKMKQIIVDQVDGMETTLAHLFPEMTANVAAPVLILVYLFVLDWRMALLSIVTIPVGMAFMMSVMGNYSRDYEGAVKTTQEMNGTIVEYINGIEVIKAFNQGKSSYAKFTDRVKANASYFYHWMKRCQFGTAMGYGRRRFLCNKSGTYILYAGRQRIALWADLLIDGRQSAEAVESYYHGHLDRYRLVCNGYALGICTRLYDYGHCCRLCCWYGTV